MINEKKVTLSPAPKDASEVCLLVVGGLEQVNGEDFQILGNDLSWDGLGLEEDLEVGDKIIIKYFAN